jgi:8-oxo-dGTP pyrophosphatase MutT (NUDIX family)
MSDEYPRILSRRATRISPWMEIVARDVAFRPGEAAETYHAVAQTDYIAILARTPDGGFPLVRQYRPAVEGYTWELPAGMLEHGEDAQAACARELFEETGFPARRIHPLGTRVPCSARLSNRIQSFFVETGPRDPATQPEAGIEVRIVSANQLATMIADGTFALQLHLGTLLLAAMQGLIDAEPLLRPKTQIPARD